MESWVYDWKNYDYDWDIGSDLILSCHYCFGSMKSLGDFSNQDCTFEHKDCYRALKRTHSWAWEIFAKLEKLGTPQTHGSWLDSKYSPELKIGLG